MASCTDPDRYGDDELAALRAQIAATPDPRPDARVQRATRSATAYLEARRSRLRRELELLRTSEQHRDTR